MATVTGLTAARMAEIEAASIVSGEVVGEDLILTRYDESTINAGKVLGPVGEAGTAGTTDHSLLLNLSNNDHPQYLLVAGGTMTGDLLLGSGAQIDFHDDVGDKIYLYGTIYGIGIEASTLTQWSGDGQFRWRSGGTSVSTGTEKMLLTETGLTISGSLTANTLSILNSGSPAYTLKTEQYTVDLGLSGALGGWARAFRIVQTSGSNGLDGGAFGAYGEGSTPGYVYMAIPTSNLTGFDSTKILALNSAGNVGIGTYTPNKVLDVVTTSASSGIRLMRNGEQFFYAQADGTVRWGPSTSLGLLTWDVGRVSIRSGSGTGLSLQTNDASTSRMFITTDGKVGIGTTEPQTLMQVGLKVVDAAYFGYDVDSTVLVHQTPTRTAVLNDPKTVLMLARQGYGGEAYGAAATFNISRYENSGVNSRTRLDVSLAHAAFDPTSNIVMTMLSSGNVGIGTATPQGTFHVIVGSTGSQLLINYQDLGDNYIDAAGSTIFRTTGSYSERVRITSAGLVGIGTSNPSSKLDVLGTAKISTAMSAAWGADPSTKSALYVENTKVSSSWSDQAFGISGMSVTSKYGRGVYGRGTYAGLFGEGYINDTVNTTTVGVNGQGTAENRNASSVYGAIGYGNAYVNTAATITVGLVIGSYGSYDLEAWSNASAILNVTNGYGGYFDQYAYSGNGATVNVTNSYGVFVADIYDDISGGTINVTNQYGLYIATPTVGTNKWALYSEGGQNYFGGNIGVKTAPSSPYAIYVAGGDDYALRALANATGHLFSGGGNGIFGIDAPGVTHGRFIVTNAGYVGVGVPNPAYQLDVTSHIFIRGANTTGSLYWSIDGSSNVQGQIEVNNDANAGTSMRFSTLKSGVLTEQMRITDQGSVGIGTTSTGAKLVVQVAASEDAQRWNNSYGLRRASISSDGLLIGYLSDGNSWAWFADNNDVAARRMGLGAHDTGTIPLYIWGSYAGQIANLTEWRTSNGGTLLTSVGPTGVFRIVDGSTTTPSLSFTNDPNTGIYSFEADKIGFTVGGTTRMIVGQNYGVTVYHPNNSSTGLTVTDVNGRSVVVSGSNGGTGIPYVGTVTNNDLSIGTNGNETMRLLTTGALGIGDTAPAFRLTVDSAGTGGAQDSAARFNGVHIDSQWSNYGRIGVGVASYAGVMKFRTGAGNVVGALSVEGGAFNFQTATSTGINDVATMKTVAAIDSSGDIIVSYGGWFGLQNSLGNYNIPVMTMSTNEFIIGNAGGEYLTNTRIRGGNGSVILEPQGAAAAVWVQGGTGNVGIGNTGPARKLHVGSLSMASPYVNSDSDIISTGGITIAGGKKLTLDHGYGVHANLWFDNTGYAGEYAMKIQGYYGHDFQIRNSTSAMVIRGDTGRVGIGTTAPSALLDINYGGGFTTAINTAQGNNGYAMLFAYYGNKDSYRHAMYSSHHGGQAFANSISFALWQHGVDAVGDVGTKLALTIDATSLFAYVPLNMGSTTGLNGYRITNVANAVDLLDAVNYGQLQGTTTVINDGKTPHAPGAMTAYAATKTIVVTWPDVTTNADNSDSTDMGGGVGRYRVEVSLAAGGSFSAVETKYTPALHATFANLTSGVNYYFRVAAIDAFDHQSDYSAILGPVVPATVGTGDIAYRTVTAEVISADVIAFGQLVGGGVAADDINTVNLKVGQDMQSTSFTAYSGWKIDGAGNAYFRGNVQVGDPTGVTLIDNGRITLSMGGGENLLPNSSLDVLSPLMGYLGLAAGFHPYDNSGFTEGAVWSLDTGRLDGKSQKIVFTTNTSTKGIFWNGNDNLVRPAWEPFKTYVFSFWSKASGAAIGNYMALAWNVGPETTTVLSQPTLTSGWQRYVFRITWGSSVEPQASSTGFFIYYSGSTGGTIWIDDIQIEEGTQPTAYIGGNRDLYMREDFFLRSGNYISGSTGFSIKGDGSAEFNNLDLRGAARSTNWNGTTIPDGTATAGWKIASGGTAEFAGNLYIGGATTIKGNVVVGSGGTGYIKSQNHSDGGTGWIVKQNGDAEFNANLFIKADTIIKGNVTVGYSGTGLIKSQNYSAGVSGWQINQDGSAEFRNITARGDIQASSVTANSVTAAGIAAGSITAEKLTVATYGDSAIVNGNFEEAKASDATMATGWAAGTWGDTGSAALSTDYVIHKLPIGGTKSMKLVGNQPTVSTDPSYRIPVVAGEAFYFSFNAYSAAATSGGIFAGLVDQNGGLLQGAWNPYVSNRSISADVVTKFEGNCIIPTDVTHIGILILYYAPGNANTATVGFYIDDVVVRKATGTVQIQDGAITANKLTTTLALVGQIQSSSPAWSSHTAGFKIDGATGNAEFNGNLYVAAATTLKGNLTVGDSAGSGVIKSDAWTGTNVADGTHSSGWLISQGGAAEFAGNLYIKGNVILGNATNPNGLIKSYLYDGTVKGWQIDYLGNATFAGGSLVVKDGSNKTWITGGGIATNAITATEIAAGAITAEKLTVASYKESAIINGSFEEASSADATMASGWTYGGWSGTGARGVNGDAVLSTTSPLSGTQSMKLTGNLPSIITVTPIPVVAGDKWYVSVTGKNPANATSAGIYIRFIDQNGAEMYDLGIENVAVGTGKTVFEGRTAIPSGVTSVRLMILWYGPAAGGSTTGFYVDDVVIRKATGAVQIIDGAITASKLETTLALVGAIKSSSPAYVAETSGFQIDGATGNADFSGSLKLGGNISAGQGADILGVDGTFESTPNWMTQSNTFAKTGTYSGRIATPAGESFSYASLTKTNPNAAKDTWYIISGYMRGDTAGMRGLVGDGSIFYAQQAIKNTSTWYPFTYFVKVLAGANLTLRASAISSDGATSGQYLYFDDITCRPMGAMFNNWVIESGNVLGPDNLVHRLAKHGVKVHRSTNFTHNSSGNWLSIDFDTDVVDHDNLHETSNSTAKKKVLIPETAWYAVSANAEWDSDVTGKRGLQISKNGVNGAGEVLVRAYNDASNGLVQQVSIPVYLSAGDYLTADVKQTSGANRTVSSNQYWSPCLSVVKLS